MGGFSDFFMGSSTPGEHGIDVAYIDDYADYPGVRNQMKDYWGKKMSYEESPEMKRMYGGILDEQYADLDRTYLGDPGYRGNSAFGIAAQTGAMTGVGPKATSAMTSKVSYELAAKKAKAKAMMDQWRLNYMGTSANEAARGMLQLPQGQRYASAAYNIQPTSTPGFLSHVAKGAGTAMGAGLASAMPGFGAGGMFDITGG